MDKSKLEKLSNTINMRLSILTGLGIADITTIYIRSQNISKIFGNKKMPSDQELKDLIFNMNLKYNPCIIKAIDGDITTFGIIVKKDNVLGKECYKINYMTSHTTTIFFNEDRKPRFYIDCPFYKKCKHKHESKYKANGNPLCMKSIRTQYQCKTLENNLTFMNQIITILYLTAKISELINNKKITYKTLKDTSDKKSNNNNTSTITDKNNLIRITGEATKYLNIKTNSTGTGTAKCEHIRSGHYRQLQNGKRVWVKQAQINKNKGKKDYII